MTLEDYLISQDEDTSGEFICAGCNASLPAFALVRDDDGVLGCGHCIEDVARNATAALRLPDNKESWDSECGLWMKAERSMLLDKWRWTIMPDSPLTLACQDEFSDYLKSLHRMTLLETTSEWTWPDIPALDYGSSV